MWGLQAHEGSSVVALERADALTVVEREGRPTHIKMSIAFSFQTHTHP